jgi:hypothetical protein
MGVLLTLIIATVAGIARVFSRRLFINASR